VTVLFADVVDSTSLVESLDPEAARDLLNETFRRLAAEVRRFGGTVEKYIGDAVFAVFGFPTGHDDDAARAALGQTPPRLRIGLDNGEVAAGAWAGDLRPLPEGPADPDLDADLALLVASGLIEPLPERLAGGQARYAFHHALFRDVAYGLLPKASRSELHRRLADWLAGAEGSEVRLPEVVADHLVQAVRLAGQVRTPTAADRRLAARAVAGCRQAARRLRDQEALATAGRVLDDAVDLADLAGTPDEDRAELLVARGTVRAATGDADAALADLGAATASRRAAVRAQAWTELSNLHPAMGRFADAAAAAGRALAEAEDAGDPGLVALALRAKARVPYLAGDLAEAERLLQQPLGLGEVAGRQDLVIDLRSTLLPVRLFLTAPLAAVGEEAHALALDARAAGRRNAEAGASFALGEVLALRGDLPGAERHYATADRLRREIGLTGQRLWSVLGLVQVAIARGEPARAVELLERSLAELEVTGHRLERLRTLAELAPALRRVGRAAEAAAAAGQALERALAMGAAALADRIAEEAAG
jgi:tetratricopeptide (TPR) repeat protein